jgi:aspartyl aminopeptidase
VAEATVERFLQFLNASPTPWHATQVAEQALRQAGFIEIEEGGPPEPLLAGTRAFLRRSGTLFAFRMGLQPIAESGVRVVSAHTDSPNLRLKPCPTLRGNGWLRLGVEVYGGVIHATWTDRDLGIAGQVHLRENGTVQARLVDIRRPLCRIPNLAIHLNRAVNDEGLKLNPQTQLPAVLALDTDALGSDPLRRLLAQELGCEETDILTWDLCLFDLTAPALGGWNDTFVFSARLDNLASCHAALEALLGCVNASDEPPAHTQIIALFDHEEIGSTTSRGATSRLTESLLERLVRDTEPTAAGGLPRLLANSWHLSADMAHAVHPAWADKHDAQHLPHVDRGPVIKQNTNQRYSTEGETAARVIDLCERNNIPYQWFVNRTDLACGTTVGPLVAAELGMRSVDVGNPMLSMHSIREMCGAADHLQMIRLMTAFLNF